MIRIFAKNVIKKENQAAYIEAAKPLIEASRAEEGNNSYILCRSINEENVMAFFEEWKDQAAIDHHNATEHFTTIVPKLREYTECPTEVILFEEVL